VKENSRSLGIAVFGILILFLGLFVGYATFGKMSFRYLQTASWAEVPATIQSLDLEQKRRTGSRTSGNNTSLTFTVTGNYTYHFEGRQFQSSSIGLSSSRDNISTYWQDLYYTLNARQGPLQATAYVNPANPTEAYLDRTLRWRPFIFGGIFVLIFCAAGLYTTWKNLRNIKSSERRLADMRLDGISCNERSKVTTLLANGIVWSVVGIGILVMVLPDALRNSSYETPLAFSVFLLIGIVMGSIGLYKQKVLKRFGLTPLYLDPTTPGIGGELGGYFKLNGVNISNAEAFAKPLIAKLSCSALKKKGKYTKLEIVWQKDIPLFLEQTDESTKASFLFDVPDSCEPSRRWSFNKPISQWGVQAYGDLSASGYGQFKRTWRIEVKAQAAKASRTLELPENFIASADESVEQTIMKSVVKQFPVATEEDTLTIDSKAGLIMESQGVLIFAALIFGGFGGFLGFSTGGVIGTIMGTIAVLVGLFCGGAFIHAVGAAIKTKIDTKHQVVEVTNSCYGFVYANHEATLLYPDQITVKVTGGHATDTEKVEYCSVIFTDTDDSKITLAKEIKGRQEAETIATLIQSKCFPDEELAAAA